jgi:hypothetical protein
MGDRSGKALAVRICFLRLHTASKLAILAELALRDVVEQTLERYPLVIVRHPQPHPRPARNLIPPHEPALEPPNPLVPRDGLVYLLLGGGISKESG